MFLWLLFYLSEFFKIYLYWCKVSLLLQQPIHFILLNLCSLQLVPHSNQLLLIHKQISFHFTNKIEIRFQLNNNRCHKIILLQCIPLHKQLHPFLHLLTGTNILRIINLNNLCIQFLNFGFLLDNLLLWYFFEYLNKKFLILFQYLIF